VKLLRVLETGTFMRVGSSVVQDSDVRVIAATNRSPEQAVASGRLREDLYYRLNVFPIALPTLRERGGDVELLAEQFLAEVGQREGSAKVFSPAARAKLLRYRWPGNVRELRNVVQRNYVMTEGSVITEEWLPVNAPGREAAGAAGAGDEVLIRVGTSMADAERQLILATMRYYNHHKEQAAAVLGISLKTLYNRLKEYSAEEAALQLAEDKAAEDRSSVSG
jgi:two-component system response regulator AtoC